MNLIDAEVTAVLSLPRLESWEHMSWWAVDVEYVDDGGKSKKKLTFATEEECRVVCEGYEFLH